MIFNKRRRDKFHKISRFETTSRLLSANCVLLNHSLYRSESVILREVDAAIMDQIVAELSSAAIQVSWRRYWCRSTSAKPAVRRSPQQRTSQVHRAGVRNGKDISKLTYRLLNLRCYPFKCPMYHVFIDIYLGNVVDTYPLSTHM